MMSRDVPVPIAFTNEQSLITGSELRSKPPLGFHDFSLGGLAKIVRPVEH